MTTMMNSQTNRVYMPKITILNDFVQRKTCLLTIMMTIVAFVIRTSLIPTPHRKEQRHHHVPKRGLVVLVLVVLVE